MAWVTLGRALDHGRNRERRRADLDRQHGAGRWRIVHEVAGESLDLPAAARHCENSYVGFFGGRPDLLHWLCDSARDVIWTSASNVRSGCDYGVQERKLPHVHDIVLRNALRRLGRGFGGERLVQIGGRAAESSPFSPGLVPFYRPEWILQPPLSGWWGPDSIESFWQSNKVVQIEQV